MLFSIPIFFLINAVILIYTAIGISINHPSMTTIPYSSTLTGSSDLSNNASYKFKLEAKTRGHWGGVWSAPKQYSFMATSNTQTNVHLLQKFNNWEFSWWQSLQNRMPWFDAKGTGQKALLTTSDSSTSYPAGSIIWGTDMSPPYYPAYWTRYGGMMDPGVIWYWVNEDDCDADRQPVDGGMSEWTAWSDCKRTSSGSRKRIRERTCTKPYRRCGGKSCDLESIKTVEEKDCFSFKGAISCHHLLNVAKSKGVKDVADGIYDIYPDGPSKPPISAYCDMSRDGGGWTLLVTSRTATWTKDNVILRNANKPSVTGDYSMLKYADVIKNNINVIGDQFEYRLEAQERGRWGGIWKASRKYTFTATTNIQTRVKLVKKFDDWIYMNNGIEERMPWVADAKLTTSTDQYSAFWGTITIGPNKHFKNAPWIYQKQNDPSHIWYWMREGAWQLPKSCMDVKLRGQIVPAKDGIYTIKPAGKQPIKTYCDLTSRGGGWTLLVTSKTHKGWTHDNIKSRNVNQPSLNDDYSILGVADAIKNYDQSQEFFQYRIEADGPNQYGGIFDAPKDYTFTATRDTQTDVELVENFNNFSQNANLATRMPRLGISADVLLSTGSESDTSGSIVYNDGSSNSPSYLPLLKDKPGVVRYWMREGTRRSCFDIKIHGERFSQSFKDGVYLVRLLNESSYLPVYCDMTSELGAYTLVVTSRHNSWKREQVPARNVYQPSIDDDYSILKYADRIRDLSNNATFKFKLEAKTRGHWGGVWSAPKQYSFMATSNTQTNVHLLQKFNNWEFSWWQSLQNRMPWFDAKGTGQKALLTTSSSSTSYPAGSIIWGTDMNPPYYPAYWTRYGGMMDPGVIWYWVNEDDCDADRLPVNGQLSEWSAWSKCDKLCSSEGKQRRYKTCSSPAPRCGGRHCQIKSENLFEERGCSSCPESPIRSYGGYCVQPKSEDCNPGQGGLALVFGPREANCSKDYMQFLFDSEGIIHHKCSGKIVCPWANTPKGGSGLLLLDDCPKDVAKHRRLPSKSLQNLNTKACVHPYNYYPSEGSFLGYWGGCDQTRMILDFFKLPPP